jgi:hypothetical protein
VATQVRFRVVAEAPTTTTIRVASVTGTDAAGRPLNMTAPGALALSVIGTQGAR